MQLKTFGERLQWARRSHARLTQQQLRDKMQEKYGADIGRNYISQMETDDTTKPTFDVVVAAARALNVSLDFLGCITEQYAPAQSEEAPPHYFSAEADEMAQLVDKMHPSQREVLLSVAKNMLLAPTQKQINRAELRDLLDSIERDHGLIVRREIEKLMHDKGLPVDSSP